MPTAGGRTPTGRDDNKRARDDDKMTNVDAQLTGDDKGNGNENACTLALPSLRQLLTSG